MSLLSFDPKFEVSLELNSFSKSFNMAGWRVGMMVAGADVVEAVLKVKSNVDSGMFLPMQSGAVERLRTPSGVASPELDRTYAAAPCEVVLASCSTDWGLSTWTRPGRDAGQVGKSADSAVSVEVSLDGDSRSFGGLYHSRMYFRKPG